VRNHATLDVIGKRKQCAQPAAGSLESQFKSCGSSAAGESNLGIFSYLDFSLDDLGEFALLDREKR
jgi:hypothetical protein